MNRLFGCTVSLIYEDENGRATVNSLIADRTELWWTPNRPDQAELWESKIELSEKFFQEIIRHPVPIDMNTLTAIKRSTLGLDLYLWLVYRTFALRAPLRLENGSLTVGNYYSQFSPFGFNGANFYVRLNYSWGMSRPGDAKIVLDQAAPQRDPERVRQEVAEQIAELEVLHDELIGHLKAIQEAQTYLWLQRWAGDRVAKAQMAKERDLEILRTNFARRAAGQDVEPLGRSAESKQLLVKDQIADLRWKNSTRLSAGGVADKWVTQLLRAK